ncbi:MAG: PKD domain-containing protein, partial [Thermoplasmatales archaeon]|nr:PKD domain-containing protein [Thermoplasmatales archaeon]
GSVDLDPPEGTYPSGTVVTLTATADLGWFFSHWSDDLSGSNNPETINMTSNKTVTAHFIQTHVNYTLNVSIAGSGSVDLDPPEGTYPSGTVVTLTATADLGWFFSQWSGDLSGSNNPETITMGSNKSVTAHFTQTDVNYTLNVSIAGSGSVDLDPPGGTYPSNTIVNTTATADPGWSFSHWSGDLGGSNNPETITMASNKSVTAHFTQDQYILTVTIAGNGTVIKNPNQTTYTYGTLVELTANADPEWTFSYWSGDLTGSKNPETITMTSNKAVTATFTQDQYTYTLTINIIGNGIVTKNPDQNTYPSGTVVTLTANADPGWTFSHWSDDLSGSNNPETINMTGDKNVTSHFEAPSGSSGSRNQNPSADANGPYSGFVDEEITFDGSGSTDDGAITNYTWDFGDSTTGYGVNPVHVYDTPGEYRVILTVTDDYGATDNGETTADIIMPNRPPFDPEIDGPQNGTKNTEYVYTAVSTDPDNDTISYIFNWDDGETNTTEFFANGTAAAQTHSWTSAGKYTITVEAYDNETYSGTTSHVVLIDVHIVDDIGYIADDDADGTYDTFHDTDVETDLGQQDGKYLIDNDGDDEWDYVYDMDTGELTDYKGEPTQPEEDYTYLIILITIIVALIIAFVALIKTKKPPKKPEPPKKSGNKNKKQPPKKTKKKTKK